MDPGDVLSAPLVALPGQPPAVPWPTQSWPHGDSRSVPAALGPLLDEALALGGPLAGTYAIVVISGGRLVAERYGGRDPRDENVPVGPSTTLLSWSMAKSMLHGVVGILVGERRLDLAAPAPVPQWSGAGDPRGAITVEHLLEMRDGLEFAEDYVDRGVSDVMEMLWGTGSDDVASYAADHRLTAVPGSLFHYSSGTSNIVSGIVARLLGPGEPYRRFLLHRLFGPIGATSAVAAFDASGTWVASSTLYATARDFARFGLLYLRDGVWDGRRLLPEGWVDHGRLPRSVDPDDAMIHGAHWWVVGDEYGSFWASGYSGQSITVCPALDLVVVRLGDTPTQRGGELTGWRADVVSAFA
ncbi:MAG TPA: serine hydrolase [Acidimicrobiales bacterium]|nr:serine hydrolase [Acidimicrobiales bacterium]